MPVSDAVNTVKAHDSYGSHFLENDSAVQPCILYCQEKDANVHRISKVSSHCCAVDILFHALLALSPN